MAAGLGFKTFNTGDVLSAADVNGYLMQGVLVFADTTARDAAITSPQEGQFAFTKNNDSLWYYSGSAWVASGATGDIEGVTAGVGISGGGTSGTVTITNSMATAIDAKGDLVAGTGADTFARLAVGANGTVLTADSTESTGLKWAAAGGGALVKVGSGTFSSSSGGSVSNCFSATYNNYMVVIDSLRNESAGNYQLALYLRTGSTNATSNYNTQITQNNNGTVTGNTKTTMLAYIHNNGTANEKASSVLWIQQPFASAYTTFQYLNASLDRTDFGGGNHASNTSYESLGWVPDDGGTNSFNITVYGLAI